MTDAVEKPIDVYPNPSVFQKNISDLPKDRIIDTDPNAYKNASADFVEFATGKMNIADFREKYPDDLDKPVGLFKTVDNETYLEGASTSVGNVTGIEASKFARIAAMNELAERIAEAQYPIIDHEKSKLMASAFINAKTIEDRKNATSKYHQLDQAFKYADVIETITD